MNTSVTERAMLVSLSVSRWTGRKFDKRVTNEVNTRYGATDGGRFNKILMVQDALTAINKIVNEARTFNYNNTQPYSDEGWRILPAANFAKHASKLREYHGAFDAAVDTLTDGWASFKAAEKQRLNGLYVDSDYPRDIRREYGWKSSIRPLPSAGHLIVDIADEALAEAREELNASLRAALYAGHKDLYARLAEAIGHMADTLSESRADGKPPIFRDTLVENVRELCALLPALDILGDPKLQAIRRTAEEKLLVISADTLRTDERAREQVARDAAAILQTIPKVPTIEVPTLNALSDDSDELAKLSVLGDIYGNQ